MIGFLVYPHVIYYVSFDNNEIIDILIKDLEGQLFESKNSDLALEPLVSSLELEYG